MSFANKISRSERQTSSFSSVALAKRGLPVAVEIRIFTRAHAHTHAKPSSVIKGLQQRENISWRQKIIQTGASYPQQCTQKDGILGFHALDN